MWPAGQHTNCEPSAAGRSWKGGARERADDVFFASGIKRRRSKADFSPTWRSGWDSNPRGIAPKLISRGIANNVLLYKFAFCSVFCQNMLLWRRKSHFFTQEKFFVLYQLCLYPAPFGHHKLHLGACGNAEILCVYRAHLH